MKIAAIKKTDFESLRNLYFTVRRRSFSWLDPSLFQLKDFDSDTKGEIILVAYDNDIPIGFISIWMKDNFIHHLYIDQHYQGKNIGTELLKATIVQTHLPITLKCLENNTNAIAFYLKKGFVAKERGQSEHGEYILFELSKNIN